MNKIWGIDLGGTKIECAVLDASYNVLARRRVPTESGKGYDHVLGQIKILVDLIANDIGSTPSIIGMGTPGSIDPNTSLLKNSNSVVLNGRSFKIDIEAALGIPVKIANDANCFALAEAVMGVVPKQHSSAEVVFGVIMGTGVGGGLVVDGKVWNGAHGIGGEWGHNFLDASGGDCYCGKSGCVEKIIAGPALEKFYKSESGESKNLKEISIAYEEGSDVFALKTINRLVHFFGLGLSSVINILDPDVVVIGGGVGNLKVLYNEGIMELEKYVFNNTFSTPIIEPILGDSAGVFGAALLNPISPE